MKEPSLSDIIGSLYDQGEDLEIEDFEAGDPDNTNVTIPIITTINAAVTYYFSPITKQALARITWSWSVPVMYDEDGNAVNPSDPDIADDLNIDPVADYMFDALAGTGPVSYRSTGGSTSVVTEGHVPGVDVKLTVYAVTRSGINGPTSTYTATVTKDTTAPPAPSTPVLTSAASVVTVTWDGLTNVGGAQPSDYNYTEIYAGTMNPPTVLVGKIFGPGKYSFLATPGNTVYVRLYSYDNVMNQSAASAVASIVVKSVLDDGPLTALLNTKARIFYQDTDPVSTDPTTLKNGDWWFTKTTPLLIKYRDAGAWVTKSFDGDQILTAASIITPLLAADVVTADNVATDAIIARHIRAGEVLADKVGTGILNAIITVSGILRTSESGKRVVMDSSGITLYDSSDTPITFINTDGESFFSGNVTAQTLIIPGGGRVEINTPDVVVNPGGVVTLNTGVMAPAAPPSVSSVWDSVAIKNSAGDPFYTVSCVDYDANSGKFIVSGTPTNGGSWGLHSINTDGSYNALISTNTVFGQFVVANGYAYSTSVQSYLSGSLVYFQLNRLNLTTLGVGTYSGLSSSSDWQYYGSGILNIGTNGSDVLVTYLDASNNLVAKNYTITPGVGDAFTATRSATKTISSMASGHVRINRGTWDIGTDSLYVPYYTGGAWQIRVYTYSSLAETTDNKFPLAVAGGAITGIGYTTKPWVAQDNVIYYYDGLKWAGTSLTKSYDFSYTYYDSVGTAHESARSPLGAGSIKRRARAKLVANGWVSDTSTVESVNALRFYGAAAGGTQYLQGSNTTGVLSVLTLVTSGTTPPVSTNFPAATPAKIKNNAGTLVISADGTIRSKLMQAKMTKTTAGHNSGGGALSASTLTKVSSFTQDYNNAPVIVDGTNGEFQVLEAGYYDIHFFARWTNYGSDYTRMAMIIKGTLASDVQLAEVSSGGANWQLQTASALGELLAANDKVSFWIYSEVSATFNHLTNPSVPTILTNVRIRKVGE